MTGLTHVVQAFVFLGSFSGSDVHLRFSLAGDMVIARSADLPATSQGIDSAWAHYQTGRRLLMHGDWLGASEALKGFAAKYPNHPMAGHSLYYRAFALFKARRGRVDLEDALKELSTLASKYPSNVMLEDSEGLAARIVCALSVSDSSGASNRARIRDSLPIRVVVGCSR